MRLVFSIYLVLLTALLAGCSREHEEYLEGRGQAKRDLLEGKVKVAFADGSKIPAFWEYIELLRKRNRIGWCSYSLPANPLAAEAWVRGYNEITLPIIEHQFGTNILKKTMEDAEKRHTATTTKDHNQWMDGNQ